MSLCGLGANQVRKIIVGRLHPKCVCQDCPRKGQPMNVVVYEDNTYRGGHHFTFEGGVKRLPEMDYWECPACYRR